MHVRVYVYLNRNDDDAILACIHSYAAAAAWDGENFHLRKQKTSSKKVSDKQAGRQAESANELRETARKREEEENGGKT